MLGVVVEQGLTELAVEPWFTSGHRVQQLAEGAIHLLTEVDYDVANSARRIGTQCSARVVHGEASIVHLGEDAGGHHGSKDAAQLVRSGVHRCGDLSRGRSAVGDDVGYAELGDDVQRL